MAARKPRSQSLCHVGTLDQSKPTASARLASALSRVEREFGRLSTSGLAPLRIRGLDRVALTRIKHLLKAVNTVNITPNPDGS